MFKVKNIFDAQSICKDMCEGEEREMIQQRERGNVAHES